MEAIIVPPEADLVFRLSLIFAQKKVGMLVWQASLQNPMLELRTRTGRRLPNLLDEELIVQMLLLLLRYYRQALAAAHNPKLLQLGQLTFYRSGTLLLHRPDMQSRSEPISQHKLRWKP